MLAGLRRTVITLIPKQVLATTGSGILMNLQFSLNIFLKKVGIPFSMFEKKLIFNVFFNYNFFGGI